MTIYYSVQILKDGTILDCYEITNIDETITINTEQFVDSIPLEMQVIVEAKDESDAIKKADARRRDILRKNKWPN